MLDWDDLRLFLTISRERRLASAGRRLGIDHTTVARRLGRLEKALGAELFHRSPRGVSPTQAGTALADAIERVEGDILRATSQIAADGETASGIVRLATPEAFGTFIVAPHVRKLRDTNPGLQLELVPESRAVSLSKREADLSITLTRPPRGRLVARRLVDYRLGLYASAEYLERAPPITNADEIRLHPIIWYIDEMIDIPELRYLDQVVASASTAFRSSSIAAQQAAVASGLGVGILHAFAADQDARLVRLLPQEIEVKRSYWLVLHSDQQRLPRVRATIDFLESIVAEQRNVF